MNKLRILLLIGVGISLLYSLIKSILLRMPARSRESARKRMAEAQWLDADSRDGALVKLTGKVRTREGGERFVSPLAETRCVALHLRALVRRGRSSRGELVEKLQIKPFVIDDDGRKVLVDATHALLDLAPARPPKTAAARKLLAEVGRQDANATTSRVEETFVELGATVTVAGTLVTSPAIKIVGDEANPIVVSSERVRADLANDP
ncbi:MAG: hypothetical protein ABI467_28300 [Kofleriaceae bacterium]